MEARSQTAPQAHEGWYFYSLAALWNRQSQFLSVPGQSHLEFHSQWSHPSCAIGMERPWISGATKTFGTIEITRLVHPDGIREDWQSKSIAFRSKSGSPCQLCFKCDCPGVRTVRVYKTPLNTRR